MGLKLAMLLGSALGAGSADARAMECAPIDNAMIEAQFDRFNAAWATKNADTVAALFAPDAVLLPTLSDEERTTPAGIRKYFVHFLEKSPVGHVDSSSIRWAATWPREWAIGRWI